ncbi:oxidoreductase, short chain dehydrogenase/reductase family protein [Cooperia oncophora]
MGRFDNRAVIVTGSSNGIGRATAVMFAKEGAMVTICGRDEKTLNETKSMVLAVNGGDEKKVFVARGDICDEKVMKEIVDGTVKAFGRLDVLVNNAASCACVSWPFHIWRKVQGEIVNVSSIAGQPNGSSIASPYYSIAKAAQDQLTRNLAIYYMQKNVRVNAVSPGLVSTNIIERKGIPAEVVRKVEQEISSSPSRVPSGRAGAPDEIAEAILFLADRQKSAYIVGHQLVIDGGSSLLMGAMTDGLKVFTEVLAGLILKLLYMLATRALFSARK